MTVYAYGRVSQLEASFEPEKLEEIMGTELLSVQTYCLAQGWLLSANLQDSNCSWNLEFQKRETGKSLMANLESGDVIICSKLERIVSSGKEAIKLIQALKRKNVQLHIVELGGNISATGFNSNFVKVAKVFSALEKRKSAERIKRVKQTQREKGRYLGGSRPFGYMIHDNGRLIENPMEQRVLKKIMELKKQGKSLRAISSQVSTPIMPISFKTVQRLLQRHSDQL